MMGLEHFWNGWANNRRDVLLIVCGSAASWMINELINNAGGLHNRITQKIKINPFTLAETEEMLKLKNQALERYQVIQIYIAMGGIPYYLEAIQSDLSATQKIQELFFVKDGMLRNEFFNLYRSLFKKHDLYEKIVEVLSEKTEGMQRREVIERSGIKSGGTLTRILSDLEESGFISSYYSLDEKQQKITYQLSDYYTSFYFRFLKNNKIQSPYAWLSLIDSPSHRAW